jgi:hypothetical protein
VLDMDRNRIGRVLIETLNTESAKTSTG